MQYFNLPNIKSSEFELHSCDLNLLKVEKIIQTQSVFRGYLSRKNFKIEKSSLDLFTNPKKFCSVFSELIQERILDFLIKEGMYLNYSLIKSLTWNGPISIPENSLYYGEINSLRQPHGIGVMISPDCVSEGFWDCGKQTGRSRRVHINDGVYIGYWLDGERSDWGTLKGWDGLFYQGCWKRGKKHGTGKLENNEMSYDGHFKEDKKEKYGKLTAKNKFTYNGCFFKDAFQGMGILKYINGEEYAGDFESGKFHGAGVYKYKTGWIYHGDFANGKREGYGIYEHHLKGKFKNHWKNNLPVGEYIFTDLHGRNWKGIWINRAKFSYMDEIIPNLFLGSAEAAQDQEFLNSFGIKFIVRVLDNEPVKLLSEINYHFIQAKDIETENIEKYFPEAIEFIDKALKEGSKVLVHCYKGISRSSTIIIAYLILQKSMKLNDAYSTVKNMRGCIKPNPGFQKILENLDKVAYNY